MCTLEDNATPRRPKKHSDKKGEKKEQNIKSHKKGLCPQETAEGRRLAKKKGKESNGLTITQWRRKKLERKKKGKKPTKNNRRIMPVPTQTGGSENKIKRHRGHRSVAGKG